MKKFASKQGSQLILKDDGSYTFKMSQSEWSSIGKQAGWTKKAQGIGLGYDRIMQSKGVATNQSRLRDDIIEIETKYERQLDEIMSEAESLLDKRIKDQKRIEREYGGTGRWSENEEHEEHEDYYATQPNPLVWDGFEREKIMWQAVRNIHPELRSIFDKPELLKTLFSRHFGNEFDYEGPDPRSFDNTPVDHTGDDPHTDPFDDRDRLPSLYEQDQLARGKGVHYD